MPSLTQTMVAPALTTVFAPARGNAKIIPSLIMVNNVLGVRDAIITVVDSFTVSVSAGAPGGATTANRLGINVSMAACVSMRDELKDIEILGQLELLMGAADGNCIVTVAWDFQ
ncbi:hypothetical protein ES703_83384 [subsurface metagenome]